MPHIHTEPGQHDMTVSAYILLRENDQWKCLVHFHRKIEKLMQIGGHIELNQTPWQAMAVELREESGYQLEEVMVLQPFKDMLLEAKDVTHPVPFATNTHNVGSQHYHSDLCYGFVATAKPRLGVIEGESADLRWLSLENLKANVKSGGALQGTYNAYNYLLKHVGDYEQIPAVQFSLNKPEEGITYKRGLSGKN